MCVSVNGAVFKRLSSIFAFSSVQHCSVFTMKSKKTKKCASTQEQTKKKCKVDPNSVVLACTELIKNGNQTLMTVSVENLEILAESFSVNRQKIENILGGFQPTIKLKNSVQKNDFEKQSSDNSEILANQSPLQEQR